MDITNIADALMYLTAGNDPVTSVIELAIIVGMDKNTVYGYRAGHHEPSFSTVRAWNKWLMEQKDCYVMLNLLMPCNSGKRCNGKVTDEYMKIFRACTDGDKAFEENRIQDFNDSISRIERHCETLRAEGQNR